MPYGHYTASWADGTGKLELMDDQKFHLSTVNQINGMQTQWNGRFEWKKAGIGETLNLCEVRKARWSGANGTTPQVQPGSSSVSMAVMGINKSSHQFRINLDGVGDIAFTKKGS